MAQRTQVILEDDLDGGTAEETVSFGLDGRAYEIDLSARNAKKMRQVLTPYIDAGRRVGRVPRQSGTSRSGTGSGSGNAAQIRAWAVEAGYEVSARGRVSADLVAAYEAAH